MSVRIPPYVCDGSLGQKATAAAMDVTEYIAASSRLSPEEKMTLMHLVAVADMAGGDPKHMREIFGFAWRMEAGKPDGSYVSHDLTIGMRGYWQEYAGLLARGHAVRVHVDTEFRLVRMQFSEIVSDSGNAPDQNNPFTTM